MILPSNETGATDDSNYVQPGPCTVHTAAAAVEPEEEDSNLYTPSIPIDPSLGPGGYLGPGYIGSIGPGYVQPEN